MPDTHLIADFERYAVGRVQYGPILKIAARPDADRGDIPPDYHLMHHRDLIADDHISADKSRRCNVDPVPNPRFD